MFPEQGDGAETRMSKAMGGVVIAAVVAAIIIGLLIWRHVK